MASASVSRVYGPPDGCPMSSLTFGLALMLSSPATLVSASMSCAVPAPVFVSICTASTCQVVPRYVKRVPWLFPAVVSVAVVSVALSSAPS